VAAQEEVMKHEFGSMVKSEMVKVLAQCAGCGKKEAREGYLGLPKGWLGFSNPLYGEPWVVEVCSWKCEHAARFGAVAEAQKKLAAIAERALTIH
jgi:hypothetical protein